MGCTGSNGDSKAGLNISRFIYNCKVLSGTGGQNSIFFRQKVFSECVSQLRKLSWILLGALSHLALQQGAWENLWCPIPLDKARGLASVVQDILTGYWKQDKQDMAWVSYYQFICNRSLPDAQHRWECDLWRESTD